MNYKDTLDFLFLQLPMYQRQGKSAFKKTLDNIILLLDHLGNPHIGLKCIHIAGTNGKGSTAHFMASILQESGLKIGMYTSPHYLDYRERIKINGQFVSEKFVIEFVEENLECITQIQPSFFEITVAMAFCHFASETVDMAIIETGLGGRLDSTNVITPLLSVITNISLDHQAMLGSTITAIAQEKAGIIKKKVPLVIGEKDLTYNSVFEERAKMLDAQWVYASEYEPELSEKLSEEFQEFPSYQLKNIVTACASIMELSQYYREYRIEDADILNGIKNVHKNTYFIGRWMLSKTKPKVLYDSAHNVAGLMELFAEIKHLDYSSLHIVFGTVTDKNLSEVLPAFPLDAKYYFCKANIPRGMPTNKILLAALEHQIEGTCYNSVEEALNKAKQSAHKSDLIVVCGSIFVIAEVI